MEIVPKHYCKDCAWHLPMPKSGSDMCRAVGTLTRDPVRGEPVWQGLRDCRGWRTGGRKLECPAYQEKS